MKLKLSFLQVLVILVAFSVVISQLLLNAYYELNAPIANIDKQMKSDIDAFYLSPSYINKFVSDTISISVIRKQVNTWDVRNDKELERVGRIKFDNRVLSDSIRNITERREAWALKEIDKIKSEYSLKRNQNLGKWGGIGLIFTFEFLAIMFGFLAPRCRAEISPFGKPIKYQMLAALAASFYAQWASCQITGKALVLLLNDNAMAENYASAFVVLVPFYFWLGGRDIEMRDKEIAMATVTTREQVDSMEVSRKQVVTERVEQVPVEQVKLPTEKIELKPKNWQDACRMKYAGEIHLSIREIAGQFGAKKWEVEHMLNGLKNEKRLPSPANRGIPDAILN